MTIEEFNERYRISVLSQCLQDAELASADEPVTYGAVEEIIETLNFAVYDKETFDEVLLVETSSEYAFLQDLIEAFGITDLELD